jgi:hypothetical protein
VDEVVGAAEGLRGRNLPRAASTHAAEFLAILFLILGVESDKGTNPTV